MGLALAWLISATALLAAHPALLLGSHAAPAVVAVTHAWMLGFFVTVATGAVYQLAPVALGTTLWNERLGWWHFGLHAAAVPGMVYAFWVWDMTLLSHFGSAVALGIGLFAFNTWKTVRRSGRHDVVAWSLTLSASWLLATVLVGLLLAGNRFWHFIPLDPIALLRAHAHLGVIGFFLTLLQGVTFQLLPMFTLGDVPNWRSVRLGLGLSQLGLLFLLPALAWHSGWAAVVGGTVVLAGMLASGWALKQTLATRKKRALDAGLQAFLRGWCLLIVAALVGLALVWPGTAGSSAPGKWSGTGYGVILIFGGLLPAFAGMMCKIVPFLTWMRAYGPKVGRIPTPAATALVAPRIQSWGLALQGIAVVPLAFGAWSLTPTIVAAGMAVFSLGVALFAYDMVGVLRHIWRPVVPAVSVSATP